MTADLSDGESDSRPENPSSSEEGLQVEAHVGLLDRERMKGGHWKEIKETDGSPVDIGNRAGDGGFGNGLRGALDLTTRFKDSSNDLPRPVDHGKQKDEKVQSRNDSNIEVLSSEGDGDEETDDDFEEGDGIVAEVVSEPLQQQMLQGRENHQSSQRKEPQEKTLPPAQRTPSIVRWESFLPQRNVKVLLAEDDDSTRHVVNALLRNCSYEVSSVANGMQAWEMLENPNSHFDLVLTDVVMPGLSGVGLLTKIMSNEAAKRIPVIMMSTHDSLDIVFRCLSKGAADFLVKPVRKNELRNLWQHVWRCQSSSGSGSGGSGSGSGNGEVVRPNNVVGSGNNTGSNDGSDDDSSRLNVRGGSDNGSGTQAVVHGSLKQKRDKEDGKDREEGQATSLQKLSNQQMGQDLEMATRRPTSLDVQKGLTAEKQDGVEAMEEDLPSTSGNSGNKLENDYNSGAANSGGSSAKAIDLIGGIVFQSNPGTDAEEGTESGDGAEGLDREASNSPANDKCVTSSNSPPLLELSLKRPRGPGEDDKEEKRELRHSGGSAFSRYSTTGTTIQQIPTGSALPFTGYRSGVYGTQSLSPAAGPIGTGESARGHFSMPLDRVGSSKGGAEASAPLPMHPRASHNGNGQDMGFSMVGSSIPEGYSQQVKDEALSVSPMSGQGLHMSIPLPPRGMMYDGVSGPYGPAMHHVFYPHSSAPPWASGATHRADRGEVFDHPPYLDHGPHTGHHHSRLPQSSLLSQQDDQVVTNQASGAPRCGSSNMAGSIPYGTAGQSGSSNCYGSIGIGNASVNGSGSGSNNMNNQNGQSCVALNAIQIGDGACNNGGTGSGASNGVVGHEHNRFVQREAALNKFRQKRKERCFEKKVRYQSRKRLAEQRPRVRGQFVRQTVYESNGGSEMVD